MRTVYADPQRYLYEVRDLRRHDRLLVGDEVTANSKQIGRARACDPLASRADYSHRCPADHQGVPFWDSSALAEGALARVLRIGISEAKSVSKREEFRTQAPYARKISLSPTVFVRRIR